MIWFDKPLGVHSNYRIMQLNPLHAFIFTNLSCPFSFLPPLEGFHYTLPHFTDEKMKLEFFFLLPKNLVRKHLKPRSHDSSCGCLPVSLGWWVPEKEWHEPEAWSHRLNWSVCRLSHSARKRKVQKRNYSALEDLSVPHTMLNVYLCSPHGLYSNWKKSKYASLIFEDDEKRVLWNPFSQWRGLFPLTGWVTSPSCHMA